MIFAHSRNEAGEIDPLDRHLVAVASQAAINATPFGGQDIAGWAGILHDVGKASTEWQRYLEACEREPDRRRPTVDHKGAGTLRSQEIFGPLAFLIQGHHGGLPGLGALLSKLKELEREPNAVLIREALARVEALGLFDSDMTPPLPPSLPDFVEASKCSLELWLRMCFSALVDADHSDTERHSSPEHAAYRGTSVDLSQLVRRLEESQQQLMERSTKAKAVGQSVVNAIRTEVYLACLKTASLPPGFFQLTVPTGGGKTRSSLAFAVKHALLHGMHRVIVAVPYLTITDQTAREYREIFGDERAVLEHHSGAGQKDSGVGEPTPAETWRRLASQDWDAPVVVTTTVQLFESLFGRSPSACRKLHRLAGSVLILDEAQTLPFNLREPIFDVLHELVAHYGASVVLCTATQPSLDLVTELVGDDAVREIAPDPPRLFRVLERVRYEWPAREGLWTWDQVATELRASEQGLAVVNTIGDALALLDVLDDPDAFHLSTLLCGAHRTDVLELIRRLLAAGNPCRVVSTQVVEAGVDLDFPLVLRALGPLDRIVQAAGRCNREGKLDRGRVVVFQPTEGKQPPGAYTTGTDVTQTLMDANELDLNDPSTFPHYFRRLAHLLPGDREQIQRSRAALEYEKVAKDFSMIEQDSVSVFVRYGGLTSRLDRHAQISSGIDHEWVSSSLLNELQRGVRGLARGGARDVLRRAQPYLVSVRRQRIEHYERSGQAVLLFGDLWEWRGRYDEVRGLSDGALDPALLVVG
jgi:CRISPR-associated endonuclease/helicase Cas3